MRFASLWGELLSSSLPPKNVAFQWIGAVFANVDIFLFNVGYFYVEYSLWKLCMMWKKNYDEFNVFKADGYFSLEDDQIKAPFILMLLNYIHQSNLHLRVQLSNGEKIYTFIIKDCFSGHQINAVPWASPLISVPSVYIISNALIHLDLAQPTDAELLLKHLSCAVILVVGF